MLIKQRGIQYEFTAPYSTKQNGIAKHINWVIQERIEHCHDEAFWSIIWFLVWGYTHYNTHNQLQNILQEL